MIGGDLGGAGSTGGPTIGANGGAGGQGDQSGYTDTMGSNSDLSQTPPPGGGDETYWRGRALQAEARSQDLQGQFDQVKQQLDMATRALAALERSRELESAIIDANAIDVETVLVMAEAQALKEPDATAGQIVADIRQRKPFLFKPSSSGGSAMSAEPRGGDAGGLDQAFGQARAKGDRRSLLKYLRVKRGA